MEDQSEKGEKLEAQRVKAAHKIKTQDDIVRRMNGSAAQKPEEQQLLNEMRQNKAAIDINRAMFDYDQEDPTDTPGAPNDRD